MSVANGATILVTEHAMWKAAERFPRFDTVRIEAEVRAALREGRIHRSRWDVQRQATDDPATLYVWTPLPDGRVRVYALRVDKYDENRFVVTTTMRGRNPT